MPQGIGFSKSLALAAAVTLASLMIGCEMPSKSATTAPAANASTPPAKAPAAAQPSAPVARATPAPTPAGKQIIRIKAGADADLKDSAGNVWKADKLDPAVGGFADGDTVSRADDMPIANTKDAAMYHNEHYSMSSFWYKVPNGKYTVKLYFAETYEGIAGPGDRVFSFKVGDKPEVKNFDIWKKAGGNQKADIETFDGVTVTDGKLTITFTPGVENPCINAIEIIPA